MDVGRKTESEGVGKGKVCTSLPEQIILAEMTHTESATLVLYLCD